MIKTHDRKLSYNPAVDIRCGWVVYDRRVYRAGVEGSGYFPPRDYCMLDSHCADRIRSAPLSPLRGGCTMTDFAQLRDMAIARIGRTIAPPAPTDDRKHSQYWRDRVDIGTAHDVRRWG